eukprot:TRINITY_DN49321_c0_g1_i1.p1 TRINITY_DN49321_c0_g1~~TRINITY_DN49321_c0_g1_i1.p1  ORF type:complete len:344 (+),score=39.40 TRINITY_DN49321_c0_g1_i1:125-1156(+)
MLVVCFFFFFKQKTAYEMLRSLVGSEMCIRDRLYMEHLRRVYQHDTRLHHMLIVPNVGHNAGILLDVSPDVGIFRLPRELQRVPSNEEPTFEQRDNKDCDEPFTQCLTDSVPRGITVMRHSIRLDHRDPGVEWSDQLERPYDTPIVDFKLPEEQAWAMHERGYAYDLLVCSPFRRCLQTAGVVAGTLNIPRVVVDPSFGEGMSSVRMDQRKVWGDDRVASFDYLSEGEQARLLHEHSNGVVVQVEHQSGVGVPPEGESHQESDARFVKAILRVRDECCFGDGGQEFRRVLIVSHGGAINGSVTGFTKETPIGISECCWVCFNFIGERVPTKVDSNLLDTAMFG